MNRPHLAALPLLTLLLVLMLPAVALAQVATLASPDPDAVEGGSSVEEVDGEQAMLDFAACLRENDIDMPDPQFGPDGPRFADASVFLKLDLRSPEFLDAMEACEDHLAALQPEIDLEQQAEQNEQLLELAECMRSEGIDFPDPEPLRGMSMSAMRGPDGDLRFDPFAPEFRDAMSVCMAAMSLEMPERAMGS